ncbi:MAG: hypothetical protein IAG13_20875 [Deltaproteobacteria bacterium]|nr:hypothetical protein [Nannocystaceae bacterium]
MKRCSSILVMLSACSAADGDGDDSASASVTATLTGITNASFGTDASSGAGPASDPDGSDGSDDDDPGVKFDIGDGSTACQDRPAGSYCDGNMSVECDGNGNSTGTSNCVPGECLADVGCVTCLDGQFACHGPRVMSCDTTGPSPTWQETEVCDSAASMACDSGMGTCVPLAPIGDIVPTGEYYQYANFDLTPDGFSQISDVDTYEDRIYFVAMNASYALTIGAYDVTLLDSDGDGMLEPNQHPDYPDAMGPVEQRSFTLVGSWPVDNPGGFPNNMEVYAKASSVVYAGPNGLRELDLATGMFTQVAPMPTWSTLYGWLAFIGYDEVNDIWYSGNEAARRVMQFDAETQTWGYAFEFPVLAGDHMDGIEVVVDVTTGTPYVYVSDMTSNFIGQYRHDTELGWVQQNLFSYVEVSGAALEGFGFGALNHFWVGSLGNTFYELGGGDLTEYIDPAG